MEVGRACLLVDLTVREMVGLGVFVNDFLFW